MDADQQAMQAVGLKEAGACKSTHYQEIVGCQPVS